MLVPRRSGPFALAVLGALLLWSAAPTARADLVFWVSGIDGCQPQGDLVSCLGPTVSIDLTLRNPDALDVAVLSATATGYGTVAQYSGAEGVSDLLNPFCLAPPGPCVGGLIASGPTGGCLLYTSPSPRDPE